MSNNVQFQNAYVEVLLDNFLTVVKQNIFLQTQSKVSEDNANKGLEMQNQANNLAGINVNLQSEIQSLNDKIKDFEKEKDKFNNLLNEKNNQTSNTEYIQKEKNRLQIAVNDYLRQIRTLEEEKKFLKDEIERIQKNYNDQIEKLEIKINGLIAIAPIAKLKKMGITISKDVIISNDDINIENTIQENDISDIKNGGTF